MSPVFSLIHALKEAKKPIVGTTLYRNLLAITIETIHANEFVSSYLLHFIIN